MSLLLESHWEFWDISQPQKKGTHHDGGPSVTVGPVNPDDSRDDSLLDCMEIDITAVGPDWQLDKCIPTAGNPVMEI